MIIFDLGHKRLISFIRNLETNNKSSAFENEIKLKFSCNIAKFNIMDGFGVL